MTFERSTEQFCVTREHGIDMAHRVPKHGSKCRNLHGHRYTIVATYEGPLYAEGEQDGMVIDFGFIKEDYVKLLDTHFDHGTTLSIDDPLVNMFCPTIHDTTTAQQAILERGFYRVPDSRVHTQIGKLVLLGGAPTAEYLAKIWQKNLDVRVKQRFPNVRCSMVVVWETPNCSATYIGEV